jgi:hypothetical protein
MYRVLAAVAALSLPTCASARADVVVQSAASGSGSGPAVTVPVTVAASGNRLLAVAVQNAGGGVSSVTYGTQTLTQRFVQPGTGSAVFIFTLVAPDVGSANVTVTGDAGDKVVGAVVFKGVDQANPVIQARGHARNDSGMIDSTELGGTVPGDAIFGAITLDGTNGVGGPVTRAFADPGLPTARWNIRSGNVIGAGATREGNRGTIPDAYVTWTWNGNFLKTTARRERHVRRRRRADPARRRLLPQPVHPRG